jgi:hypothetical protein
MRSKERYEVSEKHCETNLQAICAAVSLSITVIETRQMGHNQAEFVGATSSDGATGAIPNNR